MSHDSEGPVIDLSRYHDKQIVGDLIAYLTWHGARLDETEPCLVIIPKHRRQFQPAVICLSAAFQYDDPLYLLRAAREFNKGLQGVDSMQSVHKLADLIHSRLLDLIKIPPKPVTETRHVAEATITLASGKKKVLDLREDT